MSRRPPMLSRIILRRSTPSCPDRTPRNTPSTPAAANPCSCSSAGSYVRRSSTTPFHPEPRFPARPSCRSDTAYPPAGPRPPPSAIRGRRTALRHPHLAPRTGFPRTDRGGPHRCITARPPRSEYLMLLKPPDRAVQGRTGRRRSPAVAPARHRLPRAPARGHELRPGRPGRGGLLDPVTGAYVRE